MAAIFRLLSIKQKLPFVMVTITSSNSCAPCRWINTQSQPEKIDEDLPLRTFDLIRDAVLPDFRERVADYLVQYETVLLGENAPDPELARVEHYASAGHGVLGGTGPAGGEYVALAPDQ